MQITKGITGLLSSKKGCLCLIIFISSVFLCLKGMLPGAYFAAVVSTIASLYMWTQHRTDITSMQVNASKSMSAGNVNQ